uniref:Uncharacterized protein n=1 Tax=Glossina morsitans morsitans TaxID=37546 RepID=A0A1B0GBU6_GLOMM
MKTEQNFIDRNCTGIVGNYAGLGHIFYLNIFKGNFNLKYTRKVPGVKSGEGKELLSTNKKNGEKKSHQSLIKLKKLPS